MDQTMTENKIKIVYIVGEVCWLEAEVKLSDRLDEWDITGEVIDCIHGGFFDRKIQRRGKVGKDRYEFCFNSERDLTSFYFGLKNRRAAIRSFRTTWFDEVRHAEAIEDAIEDAVYTGREDVEIGETTIIVVYSKDKGSIEFNFLNRAFENLTMPLSKAKQLINAAKTGPTVRKDWMMTDLHKFLKKNSK